jgi:hypothetical protein
MSNKPLSSKAASLLSQLKSNVTQSSKSQYIEGLVENAAKRKLATEAALERQLAKEDTGSTEVLQVFVTKDYEAQVEETKSLLGEEAAGERFVRGEKIDAQAVKARHVQQQQHRQHQVGFHLAVFCLSC